MLAQKYKSNIENLRTVNVQEKMESGKLPLQKMQDIFTGT